MNGNTLGMITVLIGLVLFGVLYNALVDRLRLQGYVEPYTALWVTGGVLITILGIHVLDSFSDEPAAVLALMAFTASGTPMIIGDIHRFATAFQAEKEGLRNDPTETLAEQRRKSSNGCDQSGA